MGDRGFITYEVGFERGTCSGVFGNVGVKLGFLGHALVTFLCNGCGVVDLGHFASGGGYERGFMNVLFWGLSIRLGGQLALDAIWGGNVNPSIGLYVNKGTYASTTSGSTVSSGVDR